MAPFLPFLIAIKNLEIFDRSFDAETMGIIGEAFNKACKEMHDKTQPGWFRESIAKRLTEIAARGERDVRICIDLARFGAKPLHNTLPHISPPVRRYADTATGGLPSIP